jgi:hypothetical protein
MPEPQTDFQYDVFLSHSSKDKAIVRSIAERLKADGVRVWFDEWAIPLGGHIPKAVEDGLEKSRLLILGSGSSPSDFMCYS